MDGILQAQAKADASYFAAQFVGVTDYEAAGGIVLRDLFEAALSVPCV